MLVYWVKEGSVSVLAVDDVTGDNAVGSEGTIKLGQTCHPVRVAAVGMYICINSTYVCACMCILCYVYIHVATKCAFKLNGSFYRNKEGDGGVGEKVSGGKIYTF